MSFLRSTFRRHGVVKHSTTSTRANGTTSAGPETRPRIIFHEAAAIAGTGFFAGVGVCTVLNNAFHFTDRAGGKVHALPDELVDAQERVRVLEAVETGKIDQEMYKQYLNLKKTGSTEEKKVAE